MRFVLNYYLKKHSVSLCISDLNTSLQADWISLHGPTALHLLVFFYLYFTGQLE